MRQEIDNACLTETIGLSSGAVEVQAGSRPHRHNEVELNFLERGALTYLFGKQKIVVSAGQLIMFWAIMPHYILEAVPETTMHWLTLPAGRFLQWHLPEAMTQHGLPPAASCCSCSTLARDNRSNCAECSHGSRLHFSKPFLCHFSENHWPVSPCLSFVSPTLVQATASAFHI